MEPLNNLFSNELASGKASGKIQSIIFDIIFQHIQDMVFVMKVEEGPCFRYLFINEPGMKKANLTADSIGKTFQEVLPHSFANSLQRKYEKLVKRETVITFDDQFELNNGRIINGETVLTPVFNQQNSISYIVAVTRDVTEWLNEKNKIIESEQRYKSIIEHNLDSIFTINLNGKILGANPAGSMLTGYSEKQILNRSIYDLIFEKDLESFKRLICNSSNGIALGTNDCRVVHSKGYLLIVHIKTVPIVIHNEMKGIYVILKDLSEKVKNMEMIKFMAFHDQLTGLLNRRALLERLNEQIHMSANKKNEFALLSIDLDRFKFLNDTLGHLAGDEILKKVADRLTQFQSETCFIYRIGGDEFTILLLNANRDKAGIFVSKIYNVFAQSFYLNTQEYFISPSIGISLYPDDGNDAEMLIKNADEALFRVKERGKAHFQFYRTEMNSVFTNVVKVETHLRKAIDKDELTLFFQPQIDLRTGEAKCFEALLRWNDNEFGNISPNIFIPLAEDTGLIIPIGYWVIEKACQQIHNWNNAGYTNIRVAVNISPRQFLHLNLVPFIHSMIESYGIQPSSLGIEITEGAMQDKKETIPILRRMKELGVNISVDDFGTGYSSLSYLKHLPIDGLKIDRSFIKDILVDQKDAAITKSIIHLGKSLGLEVIAEGVEDKEQAEFLAKTECDKIQGFYYSKPLSATELEQRFLRKN